MRVLVIFGNIPLLGKERGNIQALHVLHESGADVLFATNDEWGHMAIVPAIEAAGMRWLPIRVARPLRRRMSVRDMFKAGRDVVQGWRDLARIIREYRPTHIHVPNEYQSIYNFPVLLLARRPVVYRLGDEPVASPALLAWLWRNLVVSRVTTFVCVSDFIRERVIASGAAPERTRVIYSFPPERLVGENGDDTAGVAPFDGITVTYVGQLRPHKGVDLYVEAALALCDEYDDVRFLVVGDYTWENPFAQALMAQVAGSEFSERIIFTGYTENVPALLTASDLHVCPSVWDEPLSNTVVEAKHAGTASVIFPSGGLPELITHQQDGFICSARTADALLEGIGYYLGASRSVLREAGRSARASLERLGITKPAFTRAWHDVYTEATLKHDLAQSALEADSPTPIP